MLAEIDERELTRQHRHVGGDPAVSPGSTPASSSTPASNSTPASDSTRAVPGRRPGRGRRKPVGMTDAAGVAIGLEAIPAGGLVVRRTQGYYVPCPD